jgi:hypothetical protein
MKTNTILRPICLLAALVLAAGAAEAAKIVDVNCNDGETISSVLERFEDRKFKAVTIVIKGTCNESPTVRLDDLTLKSNASSPNATINGTLTFDGADRFYVENLIATGPGNGIDVLNGASGSIHDSTVSENEGSSGIFVGNGAFVHVEDNNIMDNGIGCGSGCGVGIEIALGGVVRSSSNTIEGNNYAGICLFQHGTYRGDFDTISKHPTNAGAIAAEMSRNSFVELRDAEVTGVIQLFQQSQVHIRRTELDGDINASSQSLITLSSSAPGVTGTFETNCDSSSILVGTSPGGTCP